MPMKKYRLNSGFTLIEALVVIVIIGIIASFAAPSFTNLIKNQRISATTNEIISTLQTARSEAVKRSTRVTVCFKINSTGNQCQDLGGATNNTNYIYAFTDTNNNQVLDGSETVLYLSNRFNNEVIFKHPTTTNLRVRKSISFDARGNANFGITGDAFNRSQREGLFGLCDDRNDNSLGRVIRVGKTGRAQAGDIQTSDGVTC